jgi:RimJ/RimL family protein N-acetyltransferase
MIKPVPVVLENAVVRLEPMTLEHRDSLVAAASDGELWNLWYTTVPSPDTAAQYVETALAGYEAGHMLPWVVREKSSGVIVGSTRYHDIWMAVDRVEIGYTFYASRCQRNPVNTACKLLLLEHAFDVLGCAVVGLRTDNFNHRSQRAIEAIGAKKDGVIRHFGLRKDGTVRDSVMYSILASEWTDVRRHLDLRLQRLVAQASNL